MRQKQKTTCTSTILGISRLKSDRKGFLFYTVLFLVVIVTIFAVQFHQMSRHQQQIAFRFEQNEAARQIAEAAMDAIVESNITTQDVEALILANCLGEFTGGQMVMAGMAAGELALRPSTPAIRVENATGKRICISET